jgi:hypothetical protein
MIVNLMADAKLNLTLATASKGTPQQKEYIDKVLADMLEVEDVVKSFGASSSVKIPAPIQIAIATLSRVSERLRESIKSGKTVL